MLTVEMNDRVDDIESGAAALEPGRSVAAGTDPLNIRLGVRLNHARL
jgi:hypothetical protein